MARDEQKTKAELLQELDALRRRVSKLKQVEETLKHSEKQFKELRENTFVGVYRTTPDGRITMANPALVRMLGYSSFEEFSQRNLEKEGFAPQYPRSIFKDLTEREGIVVGLESAWLRRDGTTLFITENVRVIRDESGKTLYYEGIVQDITERKEAEDRIKQVTEDWSKTFDAISDLVFLQDKDFKFIKVNKSVCDLLKVKPEDLVGKKCYEVLHKSDKPWTNCPLINALKDKRPHTEEVYDPNIGVPLLISASPLFDENGELTGAVHIAKDITERKKVEEKLKQYQFMLESAYDAIFFKDLESRYVIANDKTLEAFGLSREQVIGKNDYEIIPNREEARKNIEDDNLVFKTAKLTEITKHMTGTDGKERWFQAIKTPQFNNDGKIIGLIGIARDITEHKKVEDELRQNEEKYRLLFESTGTDNTVISVDGVYLMMNEKGAERLGGKPEHFIGKSVYDTFPKDAADEYVGRFRHVVESGETKTYEDLVELPMGKRWFLTKMWPVKDPDSNITSVQLISHDITESKKVEETLKREKERTEQYLDTAEVGITIVNSDENISMINRKGCEILGYKGEELIGKNWFDILVPQRIRSEIRGVFRKLMAGDIKRVEYYENPLLTKDGNERLFAFHNAMIRDHDGKVTGTLCSAEDITERKRAEEALRESEERLRVALSAAQMGTWRWDPVTNQDTRDASLNLILGLEAIESTQPVEDFLHFVHPEDRDKVDEEIQRAIREHRTYVAEFRIIRPDGTVRWLRDQGKPLCDENDRVLCLTGAVIDITKRKKVEETLRESEERYKTLFVCAAEGIIVADTETKEFKYANPAICKMLGYTEEELGRLGVRDIHPKEDLQHIIFEFEAQARGEKMLSSSIPCLQKDGTIMYADINTAMVLIDGRQCNVGFFTDITKRKRIKTDLENYKEKVLQAQKHAYISSIGAIVAHQVNQPLTTINMLLEKALELEQANDNCCPPVLQRIEKSLTEAKKASSIIRKFNQYFRDPTLETTTNVNVSSTLNRIIFMLSERAEQAKINISTKSLDDLPEVEINEIALEQLFLIIIQNAIEASDGRKKHRLNIGGGFADSKIELQFSDDCCGIAPENLDKIFEPFFSTKSDSNGIGLGLDIVQQILISYGGEIRVESQFGKGATFYVTLPISIL